jgi:aquaporin Z
MAAPHIEHQCQKQAHAIVPGGVDPRAPSGFAGLAIGLTLTLIHLVGIPVTNLSVNPARSTGPAVFVGGSALAQLWLFWLAPLAGAVLGATIYRAINGQEGEATQDASK